MNMRILRVMDASYKSAALREWVEVVWIYHYSAVNWLYLAINVLLYE